MISIQSITLSGSMNLLFILVFVISISFNASATVISKNSVQFGNNSPQYLQVDTRKLASPRILSSPYDNSIYSCQINPSKCCYPSNITIKSQKITRHAFGNYVRINMFVQALGCDMQRLQLYFTNINNMSIVPYTNFGLSLSDYNLNNSIRVDTVFRVWEKNKKITMEEDIFTLHCQIIYNQSISSLNNTSLVFFTNDTRYQSGFFIYNPTYNPLLTSPVVVNLEDPHNKVPIQYLSKQEYKKNQAIMHAFLGVISINFLFFAVSICFKRSAIAFESLMIVQFMYFLIVSLKKIQFPTMMLAFNGSFLTGSGSIFSMPRFRFHNRCPNMDKIYKQCNAINNINLSFYLGTVLLILSLGLLLHKRNKQSKLQKQQNKVRISQITQTQANQQNSNYFPKPQQDNITKKSTYRAKVYRMSTCCEFLLSFCLELAFSMYFLNSFDYFLIAYNQKSQYLTQSSLLMVGVGLAFVLLWFVWFFFYPIQSVSYVRIMNVGRQRFSFQRFSYLIMFLFINVFGIMVTATQTLVACGFLIGFALLWGLLTLIKNIYRTNVNKIRSLINQLFIIAVAVVYILMNFNQGKQFAFMCSIILVTLLYISCIINVILCIYDIKTDQFYNQSIQNSIQDDIKQISQQNKNYANSILFDDRTKPKGKQFQIQNPKRDFLFDQTQKQEIVENQKKNLNNFRKQLKISYETNRMPDQVKAEYQNTLYAINNQNQQQQLE